MRRTRTMLKDLLPDEAFLRALYRGVKAGDGRLAMWLQEAIAFGLIDEATVPADWRERWNR